MINQHIFLLCPKTHNCPKVANPYFDSFSKIPFFQKQEKIGIHVLIKCDSWANLLFSDVFVRGYSR